MILMGGHGSWSVDKACCCNVAAKDCPFKVVCWLLNVPATCECISGTDLQRQFYVLPHWDRSCRSNFPPHPVTVYWHRADQSQRWPYNARRHRHKLQTISLKGRPPRWPSGKASASRAEGPGFECRLRRDFFGVESYQWLKNWHSSRYPARRLAL